MKGDSTMMEIILSLEIVAAVTALFFGYFNHMSKKEAAGCVTYV